MITTTIPKRALALAVGAALAVLSGSALAMTLNEAQKLLATDAESFDHFGSAVAVNGNTAVIGAFVKNSNGLTFSGAAYVFTRDNLGVWSENAQLLPSDPASFDKFGAAVALDEDTIVVGAIEADSGGGSADNIGAVYVFTRDSTGAWSEQAKLIASDAEPGGSFGWSVALHSDTLVIGAPFEDNGGLGNNGAAYVFTRDGSSVWSEQAKLVANDAATFDLFGDSVAVDGNTAVIGANRADTNGLTNNGAAYVFTRSGIGAWVQDAKLVGSDVESNDLFGDSVAVRGDTIAVGASREGSGSVEVSRGAVYMFTNVSGVWSEQTKLLASDFGEADFFGSSVAIDGSILVSGAPGKDNGLRDSGAAYAFIRDGTGNWSEHAKLSASDADAFDGFGNSVGVASGAAISGAMFNDDHGSNSGSAYIFSVVTDDEGPVASNAIATPNPVAVNTALTLTASIDDSTTGGSEIASATYTVDAGGTIIAVAQDGMFDEVAEDVTGVIPAFTQADVHNLCVVGTDSAGNVGPEECVFLAVYDPNAGFVTGGGWIHSPAGAYLADPASAGKANFGFVSKYQKGAHIPTGSTEFHFKAGDLRFHSDDYEWLVVSGYRARYKGVGTVNGTSNFGFMLTAVDESLTPSTDEDLFRIKIWDKSNSDALVYDNELGVSDDSDPTTQLGGGAIVIHSK